MKTGIGWGDTAEEAIADWKERLSEVDYKPIPKKIGTPKRIYGRQWEIPYWDD